MHAASSPLEPVNKNILLAGEVIAEKWKIGEKIGEGTFSQIYSAYSIESRDKVAVKVEAPSSLKPVLEWESLILKSLQDCPYVCRYYYHGKHGDSTVLVMELLGDSMSMLRMSPDSIHGVPLAKAVSVALEMLDCIEAFHRHGYVHRDIKASNFALSATADRNSAKNARYYIIDFGLSRQHLGEDRKVLPPRPVAEFRGTSMYASLSSHRRQELGPKDDLWSWFYLVMDFLRGELPWAVDAQQKNRETVLRLKEHYTENNPNLLVEGLPGATQLIDLMKYLQSLKYEDLPDYNHVRKLLHAVGESSLVSESSESGDEEADQDKRTSKTKASIDAIDWNAIESERERALQWTAKAEEQLKSDTVPEMMLDIAKRFKTFFDCDGLSFDERLRVQGVVYRIEKKLRAQSNLFAPPPIQSFVKRRQSEQKLRSDALRKRRERDYQVRQSLEIKIVKKLTSNDSVHASSETAHGFSVEGTPVENGSQSAESQRAVVKTDSSMEVSDTEDVGAGRDAPATIKDNSGPASQAASQSAAPEAPALPTAVPFVQPPPPMPPARRWDPSHRGPMPPPPPPPGLLAQRVGGAVPPPPPPVPGRFGVVPGAPYAGPPPPAHRLPPNGPPNAHQPPPPPAPRVVPERRYSSASDQHYEAPPESRVKRETRGRREAPAEERDLRGYGRAKHSPREDYVRPKEERLEKERYFKDKRPRSPRESRSRYPEEEGDHYYEKRSPRESHRRYLPKEIPARDEEERFYDGKVPRSPRDSHRRYPVEQPPVRQEILKERDYYEGKKPRSHSRSSRHGGSRSRHRSYSSSRSRSRSYSSSSRSLSPVRAYRRSSRDYAEPRAYEDRREYPEPREYTKRREYSDRYHEGQKVEPKREYPRKQRSRTRSSSRSVSTSRSPSPSRRRRSSDLSRPHSSRPRSSRRSHSKDYDYHHSPSPEQRHSRSREAPENPRSPKYERHSRSREAPEYPRSPTYERHRSHSRDYAPDDGSWGVDIRFKSTPDKHRRSRWQPRS